jgi:hypothetical protein
MVNGQVLTEIPVQIKEIKDFEEELAGRRINELILPNGQTAGQLE